MATRSNIIVSGLDGVEILYHHWDGYPEVVGKELYDFYLDYVKRHNEETDFSVKNFVKELNEKDESYELNSSIHGDIEYLYTLDLSTNQFVFQKVTYDFVSHKQEFGPKEGVKDYLMKVGVL